MVATAMTKMIVRPASRMFSAISFGVFCRSAPSTSAIMRSRKVEPCVAVMRTLIQSDSTRVPPVTAERSPPLSRMTGADSPVIAELIDGCDAFDHVAVAGDQIAGLDQHDVALLQLAVRHTTCQFVAFSVASRLAAVSVRALRSVAACALPRPSATASAKLANSTVTHSQTMIWKVKPRWSAAGRKVAHEDHGGERGDDLDHEHHWVLDHQARIELDERLPDRRQKDRGVQDGGLGTRASCCGFPWD